MTATARRCSKRSREVAIVGIDCAAQPENTGLALTLWRRQASKLSVIETRCAAVAKPAATIISGWIKPFGCVLLALDAPLGWPAPLMLSLANHRAGECLAHAPKAMFRRTTDVDIRARLKTLPLAIGADRIAWAAHAALVFLKELRPLVSAPVKLLWRPDWSGCIGAIEVYPKATRASLGVPKDAGSLEGLESRFGFSSDQTPSSEHERDAIVCAIAGAEFLQGRAIAPTRSQQALARQEGWIWAGPSVTGAQK